MNELTREESKEHPAERYIQYKEQQQREYDDANRQTTDVERDNNDTENADQEAIARGNDDDGGCDGTYDDEYPRDATLNSAMEDSSKKPSAQRTKDSKVIPEYYCQWSERDLFGKVNLFGLRIRYGEDSTIVKFDGIEGEWIYSALEGPYGPIQMEDLFIGAKVTVFGRHLTISSINTAATKWIEKEEKRLRKQQDEFTHKLESVNAVPCVRKPHQGTVRHITRAAKGIGQTNLRKMKNENARLGEQMAQLGLGQLM